MKKWRTKNGYHIFRVVTGRSNAYLVSYGGRNILVDTGTSPYYNRLIKNINSIIAYREHIDMIVLTHTYFDHCQNASRLRRDHGSIILASRYESEFAKKGYTPIPKGTWAYSRLISKIGSLIGSSFLGYPLFPIDIEVEDEYAFNDFDLNLKVLSTPGHSAGSISLIVDNEIAVVGDAMFGIFRNSILPPFADDKRKMFESWKKLYATGCRLFLPGHGKNFEKGLIYREMNRFNLEPLKAE
ncbi:MAG: MBL fold metallo-hydrolase [Tenuifilaceae bacterium]|nr:MBL fold metallo-hydrolase [Tenuifilaceae bacterium]